MSDTLIITDAEGKPKIKINEDNTIENVEEDKEKEVEEENE